MRPNSRRGQGGNMNVFHTPNSAAARKLAGRLKIASRLYSALVAKNADRVIIFCDVGGRVVARNEARHKSLGDRYGDLPIHDARR
jgi:hypothetical protein